MSKLTLGSQVTVRLTRAVKNPQPAAECLSELPRGQSNCTEYFEEIEHQLEWIHDFRTDIKVDRISGKY